MAKGGKRAEVERPSVGDTLPGAEQLRRALNPKQGRRYRLSLFIRYFLEWVRRELL